MGRVPVSKGMRGFKTLLQPTMMVSTNQMALSPEHPFSGERVRRIPRWSAGAVQRREKEERVSVCTVNVGTLIGRRREVVEMLARRKVDICCLQEVRYKNQGTTSFGSSEERYKLWYCGNSEGTSGVGILVKQCLAERVLEVDRISDRIIKIKILLGKSVYQIYSTYAPQSGRTAQEKEEFWEALEEEVARVPVVEGVIIGGDLNGHIGSNRDGYAEVMGPYGYGVMNREGEAVVQFCKNQNLRILNTYFKKDKNKTVTYVSGEAETQLDFVLMRPKQDITPVDCRAIPGGVLCYSAPTCESGL